MASSSSSVSQRRVLCDCDLPPRICTAKTPFNRGKKFRVWPNSLKSGNKCKFWEWVTEEGEVEGPQTSVEEKISMVKEEVLLLRREVADLKKAKKHKIKISCCLL